MIKTDKWCILHKAVAVTMTAHLQSDLCTFSVNQCNSAVHFIFFLCVSLLDATNLVEDLVQYTLLVLPRLCKRLELFTEACGQSIV